MVKKKKDAAPAGWGATPSNGNISDTPEDRRPPLDDGWEDGERPVMGMKLPDGANAHGLGPDVGAGPNPDYQPPLEGEVLPPVDPKPVNPIVPVASVTGKPKKDKKAKEEATIPTASGTVTSSHNKDPLVSYVERFERLAEEKKVITDDMKEVLAEAKGNGYDIGVLRKVLARRRMDANQRNELDAMIELYEHTIGPA